MIDFTFGQRFFGYGAEYHLINLERCDTFSVNCLHKEILMWVIWQLILIHRQSMNLAVNVVIVIL